MDILTGIGAVNGLLQGTSSMVRALKQPKLTDEAFSEIFKAHYTAASSPETREAKALEMSQRFVALRDVNGDQMLRFDESGLSAAQFAALDRDGDGQLSTAEVHAAMLAGELSA